MCGVCVVCVRARVWCVRARVWCGVWVRACVRACVRGVCVCARARVCGVCVRVRVCGVCFTELPELSPPTLLTHHFREMWSDYISHVLATCVTERGHT